MQFRTHTHIQTGRNLKSRHVQFDPERNLSSLERKRFLCRGDLEKLASLSVACIGSQARISAHSGLTHTNTALTQRQRERDSGELTLDLAWPSNPALVLYSRGEQGPDLHSYISEVEANAASKFLPLSLFYRRFLFLVFFFYR